MTDVAHIIQLRRPVVIHREPTPFVPSVRSGDSIMDEVDARWRALCETNPAFFDGGMYHVIGVHRNGCGGAAVHVCDCSYRFFAVQVSAGDSRRDDPFDIGVRPLGVKGMTWRDGRVLMGRRSRCVAAYQGQWEFAPGGVVEPGVEPAAIIRRELTEETGIAELAIPPRQEAIIFDPVLRCWELICRINLSADVEARANDEYDDLAFFDPADLPEPLTPIARQMTLLLPA